LRGVPSCRRPREAGTAWSRPLVRGPAGPAVVRGSGTATRRPGSGWPAPGSAAAARATASGWASGWGSGPGWG